MNKKKTNKGVLASATTMIIHRHRLTVTTRTREIKDRFTAYAQ